MIVNTAFSYQLCDKIYTIIVENIWLLLYLILLWFAVSDVYLLLFLMYLLVLSSFCCIWCSVWVLSDCDPGDTTSTQLQYCEQISSPLTPLYPVSGSWLVFVFMYSLITILPVLTPQLTTVMDWLTDEKTDFFITLHNGLTRQRQNTLQRNITYKQIGCTRQGLY